MQYIFLFVLSGLLGSFYDGFHTHSGTTSYPDPWLWQMAWWVPINFGIAGVAVGVSHLKFDKHFERKLEVRSLGEILSGLILFGILYFASGFLQVSFWPKMIVLGLFALCIWQVLEGTLLGLLLALATAVVGCLVEITLTKLGLFYYTQPDFAGIPAWLPFLYIAASVSVGNLARHMSV